MSKITASPSVTTMTHSSGPIAGGTVVTFKGTNLSDAYAVNFGGVGASKVTATDTEISATTAATGTGGTVNVTVVFSGGAASISGGEFTYIAPAVTVVSPIRGPQHGGTPVTITGTDLGNATSVMFGGTPVVPTSVTDTQVVAISPLGQVHGTVDIQIQTPSGLTPIVPVDKFAYIPPAITGISRTTGPVTGGTLVTVFGNGLTGATAVNFGNTGAAPVSVSDSQITVKTPIVTAPNDVSVSVSIPTGPVNSSAQFKYFTPAPANALFVIDNQTTVPDDLVFVKFLGAEITLQTLKQTYGDDHLLDDGSDTSKKSYNLAEMTTTVAGAAGLPSPVPVFQINDYSGGRIYFSLGAELQSTTIPAAQLPSDKDFNTVYGYVEPSVFPAVTAGNTNIDASYVDFIGIPFDVSIHKRADGSLSNPPVNNPLTTPEGSTVFNALIADNNVPSGTKVTAETSATNSQNTKVSIGGTARIMSPSLYQSSLISEAAAYHDWTSSDGLIDTLQANGTTLSVASYTTAKEHSQLPANTLFGFAGSPSSSIAASWSLGQNYTLTAQALTDLNPNGTNTRIPSLEGIPGIKMSGSGTSVDSFDIYITNDNLNDQTGIYGANPPYTVDWLGATPSATAYELDGIQNDLSGRVVGDLLAGFNFGWAGCVTTVTVHAKATNTASNLSGTIFDSTTNHNLGGTAIGKLSTGQFFYLLSLQPSTVDIAKWFGESIQPDKPTFYNNYASDFQALTQCYNMAFTDRLQGQSDPDMFFTPGEDNYVKITLLPGAYTVQTTPND